MSNRGFLGQIGDAFRNNAEETKTDDNQLEAATEQDSSLTEEKTSQEEVVAETQEEVTEAVAEEATEEEVSTDPQLKAVSEETTEEPEAKAEDTTTEEAQTQEVDYDSYIQENGYKSPDEYSELETQLEEYKGVKEILEDDLISTLIERKKRGLPIDINYLYQQSIDYDSLDVNNLDIAKELIMQNTAINEGIDQELVRKKVERKFRELSNYDPDEEEYKDILDDIQYEAAKAKINLKKIQQENKLPESAAAVNQGPTQEQVQAQYEQQLNDWKKRISSEVKTGVDGYSEVTLGEGDNSVTYELSAQDKKSVEKWLKSEVIDKGNLGYTQRYFDGKGWDTAKMVEDAIWMNSDIRGRAIEKLINTSAANGGEKVVNTIKNTKVDKKVEHQPTDEEKRKEALARQTLGAFGLLRK